MLEFVIVCGCLLIGTRLARRFLVGRDRALAVAAMAGTDSAELAPQKGAATL
jgi:hypothetical protein